MKVDEENDHAPSLEDCRFQVEDALTTPDNDHFGIKEIEVTGELFLEDPHKQIRSH